MDDNNFYPPSHVKHAVEQLLNSDKEIAGLSSLPVLCIENPELWLTASPAENHATPAKFAFKRSFLDNHNYKNEDVSCEEREFLNNFKTPIIQLDPFQTILFISHTSNMRTSQEAPDKHHIIKNKIKKQSNLSGQQRKALNRIREEHLSASQIFHITEKRFVF